MLYLRIAGDRTSAADKGRDFIALHSRGHVRKGRGSEGLRDCQRVSEFVDFNDVGDVAAATDEPDHAAGENQREDQQPAGRYLPVAFAENEIGVSLIPFPTRFDVEVCCSFHTSACV